MRFYAVLAGLLLAIACGNRPKAPDYGSGSGEQIPEVPGKDSTEAPIPPGVEEIALVKPTGSQMRLMDAVGLTEKYKRIFAKDPAAGYRHCQVAKPVGRGRKASYCYDSLFDQTERVLMGSFDIVRPAEPMATSNVNRVESLTLNYMRSLRSGLARECRVLVAKELEALKAGNAKGNFLVKATTPTRDSIEEFFRRIEGIEGTGMKIDLPSASYMQAFAAMKTGGASDQVAYETLCLAVAMDPQIFLF